MSSFIFDHIDNLNYQSNPINSETIFNKHSKFIFDKECLTTLSNNSRESYKIISKNIRKKNLYLTLNHIKMII